MLLDLDLDSIVNRNLWQKYIDKRRIPYNREIQQQKFEHISREFVRRTNLPFSQDIIRGIDRI